MVKNINMNWFKKHQRKIKLFIISVATVVSFGTAASTILKVSANADGYPAYTEIYDDEGNVKGDSTSVEVEGNDNGDNTSVEVGENVGIIPESFLDNISFDAPVQPTPTPSTQVNTEANTNTNVAQAAIPSEQVSLANVDLSTLRNLLYNHRTNYAGSEFFNVKEALARYNAMPEYESTSDLKVISNRQVNEETVRAIVLNNNAEFMNSYLGSRYEELSSSYLDTAIKAVVNTININLAEDTEGLIDVAQLDENLQNLKIFRNHSNGNGELSEEDKIISLNVDVIEKIGGPNFFYEVTSHETHHLIQASSNIEKEHEGYSKNTGLYYEWEDLAVNPLAYQWYVEGSAEKLMNVYNNVSGENVVYPENIKTIDSLTLTTIMRDDCDELTIPRLSLQHNLEEFFKVFNCQSDEDKEEVIDMMYSFEIIYNKSKAFYDASQIKDRYKYEFSLYSSVAQTLTKTFYRNLLDTLSTKTEDLNTVLSLIKVFENDMNRLAKFTDTSRYDYNAEFLSYYRDVRNSFFTALAQSLNVSYDEVYAMYEASATTDFINTGSYNLSNEELSHLEAFAAKIGYIKPAKDISSYCR